MTSVDTILALCRGATRRFRALVRMAAHSVRLGAQPPHAPDCRRAAEWLAGQLRAIGFTAELKETAGHPVVLGHHPGPAGATRHLLFYGHYDVQPAEPMELWTSPPFEPVMVEGPNGRASSRAGRWTTRGR